jgi:hypothetical protein
MSEVEDEWTNVLHESVGPVGSAVGISHVAHELTSRTYDEKKCHVTHELRSRTYGEKKYAGW